MLEHRTSGIDASVESSVVVVQRFLRSIYILRARSQRIFLSVVESLLQMSRQRN